MFEGFAPLRWCLFAEPVNVYRGTKVRLEAVLADEDALPPGDYPALVQVIGPDNLRVFERKVTVTIPAHKDGTEPPLAFPVFTEEVPIDGPAIKTRPFMAGEQKAREVLLVGARPPADARPAFVALAQHIAQGSTAVFLSPEVFKKGDGNAGNVGWLPLANKGALTPIRGWLYLKDEWAKRHPIFEGLPSGGLMD